MRYFSIALSMADSASASATRPTCLIPAPISEMRKAPAMSLLVVLDLVGTFVFAISGASAGVTRRLDLFGTLVLSFVAGNLGGVTRDVLIGSVPPPPRSAIGDIWQSRSLLALSPSTGLLVSRS